MLNDSLNSHRVKLGNPRRIFPARLKGLGILFGVTQDFIPCPEYGFLEAVNELEINRISIRIFTNPLFREVQLKFFRQWIPRLENASRNNQRSNLEELTA